MGEFSMSRFVGNGAQQQIAIGEDELIGTEKNGISAKRTIDATQSVKVTESGTTTYIATAVPGASQSDPVWRAMKINESSGVVITYADGNPNYDNVATNLSSLTYS
jgi:hypothetical protein